MMSSVAPARGLLGETVIFWATNMPIVAEASADVADAGVATIATNTLTDGWVPFTDPNWKGQPARFYRVRRKTVGHS